MLTALCEIVLASSGARSDSMSESIQVDGTLHLSLREAGRGAVLREEHQDLEWLSGEREDVLTHSMSRCGVGGALTLN